MNRNAPGLAKERDWDPGRCRYAARCRGADFQSAVSQTCSLQAVARLSRVGLFLGSADYKSAIQQNTILRYAFGQATRV